MSKPQVNDPARDLRAAMAERTGTRRDDWFCVYKARYGMQVVFGALRERYGVGEVLTQLFTCCTAVAPIMSAGLSPRYVDLADDSLALDASLLFLDGSSRALLLQHTFGIVLPERDAEIVRAAHAAGAIVVEDSAHCVGRMSRDGEGRPLADVSIHSFGVEKQVSDTYFGGMVWVNPAMNDPALRDAVVAALSSLPPVDESREKAAKAYRNQLRVLTRLPHEASERLRARLVSRGSFEPAVSDAELAGELPLAPSQPGSWVAEQALGGVRRLDGIEARRSICVDAYLSVFADADESLTRDLLLPADLPALYGQPLLRFPVSLPTSALADLVRTKVAERGFYAVNWGRPLLYPGPTDLAAFGWDGSLELLPRTKRWSRGIVGLPTDIGPVQARELAQMVLALVAGKNRESMAASAVRGESPVAHKPANLALVRTEDDVRARLVPVCVGGDLLAYAYTREFHKEYGLRPIVLSSIDVRITSSSKHCEYRVVPGMNDEATVVEYLGALGRDLASQGKVGLVLGLADWQARVLSAHKEELSEWFVVPYIDFALLDEITQKRRFYELCEELDIPYPHTWYLPCPHEHEPLDTSQFPYPLIAKPSNSAAWDAIDFPGKKKIYEIETPEELTRAYEAVCAGPYEHELIIQDFIPGGDDAIRSLTTFSDAQGRMRVVAGGRVALQDHSPLAIGNPVCILSEKVDAIIEGAERFLARVGYRGYANFDIKYDERDGSYRFFEVNTRPGRNTYYVSLGGVSFVRPIVDEFVLGREVPYREAYDPYLYTIVPPVVVKRSVEDPALRDDVLAAYRDGRAHNPLDYNADCVQHKLYAKLYTENQVRKFKKYLWDTGGKQADV